MSYIFKQSGEEKQRGTKVSKLTLLSTEMEFYFPLYDLNYDVTSIVGCVFHRFLRAILLRGIQPEFEV